MASQGAAAQAAALWSAILAPLVTGGPLVPLRPLGPAQARAIAGAGPSHSAQDSGWVGVLRVRVARRLCRVDTIESPDAWQWLMAAALNDLLQCTNPTIDGVFSSGSGALLAKVEELVGSVPPPLNLREALSRHATFARVLHIERCDTRVSWWSGSRQFRGLQPPARLLRWKRLRRVDTRTEQVRMARLASGSQLGEPRFQSVLSRFLSLSPLTDLWTAGREQPAFGWTGGTLALLASVPGRVVALRALRSGDLDRALAAVQQARLPLDAPWREAAQSLAEELAAFSRAG